METNAPWLTCRMGKKVCLLAKDEKAYYIIEVGKNLDYATEEWLEQQGVSEELLKELQIPFEYIPRKVLHSVAFSGYKPGETMYLYLKNGKRVLELAGDVQIAFLRDFFPGIPRTKVPKDTPQKNNPGWRKAKRDPKLYEKVKWVPFALVFLSLGTSLGCIIAPNAFWFTLWLAVLAIPFALDILMPGYFTLFFSEKGKKQDAWGLETPLCVHLAALFFMRGSNWLDGGAFWPVFGICAAISGFVCLLAEEFRRNKLAILAAMFLGAVFGLFVAVHMNEVYALEEPKVCILEVEETHKSGGRSTNYYCTVTLPDGREESLNISRKLYNDLEEGDLVRVEVGEGFFGIEYANAYPYKEGE